MINHVQASILRIRHIKDHRIVVGAGFLVDIDKKIAVTCAHVINDAINKPDNQQKPQHYIYFDLPFISDIILKAKVITFLPRGKNHTGDIAVLQIIDNLPPKAKTAKMQVAGTHSGNDFSVFGFPQAFEEEGRWAEGKLQDHLVNGQIQAVGTSGFGYFVEKGFSGSPVYDKRLKAIVGMMTRIDAKANIRAAFITPLNKIREICPDLKYEDMVPKSVQHNMYFSNPDEFTNLVESASHAERLIMVFHRIVNTIELALRIFIISTIRIYESEIINEPESYRKKVVPIKNIIAQSFREPSFKIILALAEKCFYLIDSKAPEALTQMKHCLAKTIELGPIGQFWEDLENIFPPEPNSSRYQKKPSLRREFLKQVLQDIANYANKSKGVIDENLSNVSHASSIEIEVWMQALGIITEILQPIFSHTFIYTTAKNRDPLLNEVTFEVRTYQNGQLHISDEIKEGLNDEYETEISELILGDNLRIYIYPFLTIQDDSLCYYKRTTSSGYGYYSILLDRLHIKPTRKKFNQSVFHVDSLQLGSKQELFWMYVLPVTNKNGVSANIPTEDYKEFIGRKKQRTQIYDEVISIPNENAIIYGLGGMGKTSLMIELAQELFNEKSKKNILFENIVWVSAKHTFYDYIFDTIEKREPQVRSLDSILLTILNFFNYEGIEDYSFEDRKELVLEIFEEQKILLIVDNFETIKEMEADKIIEFFGTHVKKRLRYKPINFKVILTSREKVISGFRQIELPGMNKNDTKQLIDSLYKRYRPTQPELTNEQKDSIYEATRGIPILIKHCIAKIYEYSYPFSSVIRNLVAGSTNIVQFSFSEILDQIAREDNRTSLEILFLLDIAGIPLMMRQIADILEVDERVIETKLPLLANFECIKRVIKDNQEKYQSNDEIYLLVKNLIRDSSTLYQDVRTKHFRNFSFDRRMDYTSEEETIINIFESYIKNDEYPNAQDFLERELTRHPDSVLLSYYYAKYLKDRQNNKDQAIKILESIRTASHNHPSVLKLLFLCYVSTNIPRFESAENIVSQIQSHMGDYLIEDVELQLEIARFYIRWSVTIKSIRGIDPFEENRRQTQYKELARRALDILDTLEIIVNNTSQDKRNGEVTLHEIHYRISQCYYNLWEYDKALSRINRAIKLASGYTTPSVTEYMHFKNNISRTRDFYMKNPGLDRR